VKPRPKRTLPDANQKAEHAKLTGWGCVCYDVHNLPGNEASNPLDAFIFSPDKLRWLQVEWKVAPGAPFRPSQEAYFKSLGIWDLVLLWLDPVVLYEKTGIPVVVAWKAEQVMDVFSAMEDYRLEADKFKRLAAAQADWLNCRKRQGK